MTRGNRHLLGDGQLERRNGRHPQRVRSAV
ncbi:Uncharacterised protein [Vibrio cholerae]|nr:Uncharacterised protein [Vibrio cholerae]CSI59527.1 Uncharacterised protein [Vibrio cholerae]